MCFKTFTPAAVQRKDWKGARLYREASIGKKKWEPQPENGSDDGEEWMNGRDIKMEKAAQF